MLRLVDGEGGGRDGGVERETQKTNMMRKLTKRKLFRTQPDENRRKTVIELRTLQNIHHATLENFSFGHSRFNSLPFPTIFSHIFHAFIYSTPFIF